MKILLTGTRSFVACDIARTLHRQGHTVFAADSASFDYVRFSNAVTSSFRTPSSRFDEQGYIDTVINIINKHHIDKVVPLGEEVFYLARNRQKIATACPNVHVHTGTIAQLETLHNKYTFHQLAQSIGIKVPRATLAVSPADVVDFQLAVNKHVMLKPVYSQFGAGCIEMKHINQKILSDIDWSEPRIVQEYITGRPVASYSYSVQDEVLAYVSTLSPKLPGAMPSAIRIDAPQAVRDADKALRSALQYDAQMGLDFIENEDGMYLLECNPRATIGYSLTYRSKVQSRLMMFQYLIEGMFTKAQFLQFIKVFFTFPDTLWSIRDAMPALASQLGGVGDYLRFRRAHPECGMKDYATYDMKYDGPAPEFKLERAVPGDSGNILKLLESRPVGGAVKTIYTRQSNAYRSLMSDGEAVEIGVVKDGQGDLVLMSACAVSSYYMGGGIIQLGYVSDLRKDAAFPYVIDWFNMLIEQSKSLGGDLFFFSVMQSNKHAIDVLTKKRSRAPAIQKIATYTLYIVNPKRVRTPVGGNNLAFVRVSELPAEERQDVIEFINLQGQKHDYFPVVKSFDNNHLNVRADNSYVLKREGEIVGFACLNDQRYKKQFVIKEYAWYIRPLLLLNPLLRVLGLMPLPAEGAVIDCPAISIAIVRGDDELLYRVLIGHVARQAAPIHPMLMITIPDNGMHTRFFSTPYNMKIKNNLYALSLSDKEVRAKNVFLESAIFF